MVYLKTVQSNLRACDRGVLRMNAEAVTSFNYAARALLRISEPMSIAKTTFFRAMDVMLAYASATQHGGGNDAAMIIAAASLLVASKVEEGTSATLEEVADLIRDMFPSDRALEDELRESEVTIIQTVPDFLGKATALHHLTLIMLRSNDEIGQAGEEKAVELLEACALNAHVYVSMDLSLMAHGAAVAAANLVRARSDRIRAAGPHSSHDVDEAASVLMGSGKAGTFPAKMPSKQTREEHALLGTRFTYSVDEPPLVLGQGRFGRCYQGYDTRNNVSVAIKAPRAPRGDDDGADPSFVRELAFLRMLTPHKNVAQFLDGFFSIDSHLCLVSEMHQMSFADFIEERGRDYIALRAEEFAGALCSAIAHVHSHGLAHLDVRPDNFVIDTDGVLRLIDFGSARMCVTQYSGGVAEEMSVHDLRYASPELIIGMEGSFEADAWSLGCMIAELFSGRVPFDGETEREHLEQVFDVAGTPAGDDWLEMSKCKNWHILPQHHAQRDRRRILSFANGNVRAEHVLDEFLVTAPARRSSVQKIVLQGEFPLDVFWRKRRCHG